MENLHCHTVALVFWFLIVMIRSDHLLLNWKIFNFSYKMVLLTGGFVSIVLLFFSIYSDTAMALFVGWGIIWSGLKIYKSRFERSIVSSKIDDSLYLAFPSHKEKNSKMFAYWWHFLKDLVAGSCIGLVQFIDFCNK